MKTSIQQLINLLACSSAAVIARRSQALGTDPRNRQRPVIRVASTVGLLAGALLLLAPATSPAADGEMTQNTATARTWTDAIWTPAYANGIDSAADFGNKNWTGNKTITTTSGIILGIIRFADWTGAQWISCSGANALTFQVSSGTPLAQSYASTLRMDCPMAGSQGMFYEGFQTAGTVELRNVNTYTGPTTVAGGVFLWFRNGTDGRRIDPADVLTFAGGSIQADSSGYAHTAGSTTVAAGSSTVINGITLNAITRQTGGVLSFGNGVSSTDTSDDASGILGGWAIIGYPTPTDWAHSTASAADTIVSAYTGYTDIAAIGSTIADDSTKNVRFNSAGSGANAALAATVTTANTLLHNTATAVTIDTAGKTLRLGPTGGVFDTGNGAALTIGAAANDGTLTAGGADNTAGDVIIINHNAATVTINAAVADNGSGSVAFTKAGSGPVTLATANTYTGNTTVGAGTLMLGSATAIPTGAGKGNVKVDGTLDLNGNSITVNGLSGYGTVNSGAAGTITLTVGDNNSSSTFLGKITTGGATTLNLTKTGTGTVILAGNNTYNGTTTISGGALSLGDGVRILWGTDPAPIGIASASIVLNNSASLILSKRERTVPTLTSIISGSGSVTKTGLGFIRVNGPNTYDGDTTISAGTWKIGGATSIPSGSGKGNLVNNASIDLNGNSILVNGFSGSGNVYDSAGAGTSILTVGVNDVTSSFSGAISNGIPTATRLLGLTKTGTGTLTLSGVSRYNAATTVNAGTLLVSGSLVAPSATTAASAVTVNAGATLGGTGTIGGVTTITASGTLAPGASIGTLTFTNNLGLSGTTSMEINKTLATADKIVMTSPATVTLGGNLTVVNLAGTLALNDTFDLIDGTISGTFGSYTLPTLATGLAWDTTKLAAGQNGTIKVVCDGTLAAHAGSPVSTCSGVGVGIGGSPTATGGSGTGYTYLWSPATGLNDATLANPTASPTTTTPYTVTVTDSVGCTAVSSAVTVTVNLPTITLGANPHVCPGTTSADLTYSATTCTPDQYAIDFDAAAEAQGFVDVTLTSLPASPITITVPGAAPSATYNATLTVKNTTSGDVSAGVAITVTVDAPPAFSEQPTNVTVATTSSARFYVTATGAGLTYQWQRSGDGGSTFTNIPTASTFASYTNSNSLLAHSGYQFRVIVSGTCPSPITSSPGAVMTVVDSPKAVVSGDATFCLGGSTTISAALTGTGPWDVYWSDGVTQSGVNPSPATRNVSPGSTTVYTVTNLTDTTIFPAFPSDLTGSATVTVNYAPAITAQPTNFAACQGTPAAFYVSATGTSLTYQWRVSGDGGINFTNISDTATNASYTNLVVAAADNNNQYEVVITGVCPPAVTSAPPAVLTVRALPTLSVDKTDVTCNGAANGTVVATYGGGTGPYTISIDGGLFTGATGSPQTFTGKNVGTHTVEVLDVYGCSSGVQTTAAITQPTVLTANAGVDVTSCASTAIQIGGSPTASGGTGPYTYLWTPATGLNDATLANPTASAASTTTYTVTVTDANSCTANDSVVVNRAPTDPLSWVTGSANWDFTTIADRWQDATPRAAVFCNGHSVVLGDSATVASPVITLNTTVLPSSVTANGTTNAYTISGTGHINGGGSLTKTGSGTLTLTTANGYSGGTTVSAGVLDIQNASALGVGDATVSAGALRISGDITVANGITINGTGISSGGALRNVSGSNTISSGVFVTIASNARINSDAGTLHIGWPIQNTVNNLALTVGGAGDVIMEGDGFTGVNAQLVKDGAGVLTITAGCNHRLQTVVSGGTLKLGASDLLKDESDLVVNGTFDLNGFNETVDGLIGSGSVIGGGTLTVGTDSATNASFSGIISGSTALVKDGTLIQTLSGANTYSGNTTISAGTLRLGAAGVIPAGAGKGNVSLTGTLDLRAFSETINGLSGAGTVDTSNGGTPTFTVGGNDQSGAFSGVIQNTLGTLALTKTGAGTLTLSGVNTYVGNTLVSAGTLLVNSPGSTAAGSAVTVASGATLGGNGTVKGSITVNAGGILAPGASIGTLTNTSVSGVTFDAGSTNLMQVNLTNTPANADKLVVTAGTLTLGGTLVIDNIGPALTNGAVFDLFDATVGTSGSFSAKVLPVLTGLAWDTSQLSVNGTISVASLTLSPTSPLPNGQVASNYSQTISANGGDGGYTFAVTSGTLPVGLTLDSAGLLSGTPSAIGFSTFTVTVTDGYGSTSDQVYNLTIVPGGALDILSPSISITGPANMAKVFTTPTNITGTAKDFPVSNNTNGTGVTWVYYGMNGNPVTNLATLSGTGNTNWAAAADMVPGTNTITVYAKDLAGNPSTNATRQFILSVTSLLTRQTNGTGKMTATTFTGSGTPTNGAMLELGRAYTVTAGLVSTSPSNFYFHHWDIESADENYTNTSTSAALTFTMRTNLTLRGNFYSNAPSIAVGKQPVTRTNYPGSLAFFSVTGVGAGLTYQWRTNGVDLPSGTPWGDPAKSGITNSAVNVSDTGGGTPLYSATGTNWYMTNIYYDVVICNAAGCITSSPANLMVKLEISKQPVSRTNYQGSLAWFSVTGVGAGLTYHWRTNGVDIPGATQSGYTNPAVNLSDGGDNSPDYDNLNYDVAITNAGGYLLSGPAHLKVNVDTNKPAVAFTTPMDKQEFTEPDSQQLVKGTAGDLAGQRVTNVFFTLNGGATNPVGYFVNSTYTSATWSNVTTLAPGTNLMTVQSVDFAGNWSLMVTRKFFYRTASTLTLVTNDIGSEEIVSSIVSVTNKIPPFTDQPTNGGSLFEGRGYTVTAVDGPNYIFTNWLASVNGGATTIATNHRTLKFMMQTNLQLTAVFVTNVYNAGVGTYNGLFSDAGNGPSVESAGFINLIFTAANAQTKPKPAFSGTLYLDGYASTFSGNFEDLQGHGVSKPIVRPGLSNVLVSVHMGLGGEDQITGTVSNVSTVPGESWGSDLVADRSVFSNTNLATGQQGIYTMIISNNPATAATTNSPGGDGYLTVHVETNGLITAQGYLADGFALKAVAPPSPQPGTKVPVSKNGYWPLFAQLYKDQYVFGPGPTTKTRYDGILMGWVSVTNGTPDGLDTSSSDGLYWIKRAPVTNTVNFYAGGFTNDPVQVVASTYTPPVGLVRQIPLNNGSGALTVWGDGYLVGTLTAYVNLAVNNNWTVTGLGGDLTGLQKFVAPVIGTKPDVGSVLGYQTNAVNPNAKFPNLRGVVLQNQGIVRGAYGMGTNQSGFMRIDSY